MSFDHSPLFAPLQYVSILELLGSVDMMSRNLPYRKYRPDVPVHTNAYQWYKLLYFSRVGP